MWDATITLANQGALTSRAANSLQSFILLIDNCATKAAEFDLYELIDHVIRSSGLYEHYKKDKTTKGQTKSENLEELINSAMQYKDTDLEIPE